MSPGPDTREPPAETALTLLGSVGMGRVMFSRFALPAVRPADHIVDADQLIIRAGSGISMSADSQAATYEADSIDHRTRSGWYVTVTGIADTATDVDDLAHYRRLLRPGPSEPHDRIIRICPRIVTGIEFIGPRGTSERTYEG
ncbi:pyridoxamine 5'-phosphate oxidase family protein [Nocardia yunnanensis]|uniref:Pyridoxamine 5'-phosphate oxidase family protein n=1 Tax=Nocardia yunnanensis TaxID=2382165 RepID=A0A386ZEI4_9NOCA|nr:pyridoxamine 5'-phosphate oxidase family protein [Nocardia yunnanensis]AYF74899.1 pyridoxamine 5'-phosphate oxidase family protein [Nocardia yunnanensis]